MTSPAKTAIDGLISARWIIPVQPAGVVLEQHSLAVDKGLIVAVLPTGEAEQRFSPGWHTRLPDHALTPGLVNAHGHAAMSLFRGMADDHPLMTWLEQHVWPAEGRWVGHDFVADGARLAIAEMLQSGTTTFSDMYFFPEATGHAAQEAGLRAQLCFPILEMPTAWARDADEYLHKGLALHDTFRHSALVSVGFGPHAPYTVSDGTFERVVTLAEELDAPVQVHLHETAFEVASALEATGKRPLQRLAGLGLLGPRTQCVHMTQLDDDDIALVAHYGAHVVHCPESNLKLASGFCPVEKLRLAGVNVALGTDGAASNNDLDLPGEMRTAALLAKAVAGDAAAVPAHYALRMATLNGATALGLQEQIGSLEVGKQADIAAFNLGGLAHQPVYQPLSQLVYTNSGPAVSHVWVGGRPLLAGGQLTTLDAPRIAARAVEWSARIRQG